MFTTWEVRARHVFWILGLFLCGHMPVVSAQTAALRMVIGTDVACRAQPELAAPAVGALQPGDFFLVSGVTRDASGEAAWYEQRGYILRGSCWVAAPLTTAYDSQNPDAALLAVAEHALELGSEADLEHLVRIDNLLTERERGLGRYGRFSSPPPLLQLRHLEVVDRAARAVGGTRVTDREPMRMAWVLGHSSVVNYFEPGGLYHVPSARFWELYEENRTHDDAEQVAWAAAEAPIYTDECYTDCNLSIVAQSHMRYWSEFPDGNHVVEAIATANNRAERAVRYCVLVAAGDLAIDSARIGGLVEQLRASLVEVTAAVKDELLAHLSEIEQTCVPGNVDGLQDPRAIPGLARALGSGFSIVKRSMRYQRMPSRRFATRPDSG